MNCEELNKDIAALRASREGFQEQFDLANTNLRGGIELRKTQKEALKASDELLLKYFKDFEKQYPDKWFRKFGEFKKPTEEEASELAQYASNWKENFTTDRFEPGTYKNEIHAWVSTELRNAINNPDVSSIKIGNGGFAYEFLPIGKDDGGALFKQVLYTTGGSGDFIQTMTWGINENGSYSLDNSHPFSIEKKRYTKTPMTLAKLNDNKVLVGCKGGGISLIGEREDGSWGILADKRWVPNRNDTLGTIPKAFILKSGRVGLYNLSSQEECVFELEKNLNKLKQVLEISYTDRDGEEF